MAELEINRIMQGDNLATLRTLPDECIDMCVTSPPYYALRDYGCEGQIGLEDTPELFIERLVEVFREVRRVLKDDGTLWVNIGDSYNGSGGNHKEEHKNDSGFQGAVGARCGGKGAKSEICKPKDLIGIPWMLAFALRADGWYLRQDIIWNKPNAMPEPAKDRCNKSHEYLFLLSKKPQYHFDYEVLQEPAIYAGDDRGSRGDARRGTGMNAMSGKTGEKRNKRDVWSINTKPCKEAHFAVFPEMLVKPCIEAGCREGGVVLDPFMGSGTTAVVARKLNRNYIGCELNPEYITIAEKRLDNELGLFR